MDESDEVIHLRGSTGKPIKMTMEELSKKKICGEIEISKDLYYVKITRWYRLDRSFTSLAEATSAVVKLVQKIERYKRNKSG